MTNLVLQNVYETFVDWKKDSKVEKAPVAIALSVT